MYPNYIENRKALGYKVLNDTSCGMKLMLITDSTVILIRNFPSNVTHKTKRVILVNTFESDVTGMTPLSPMNENSSPGFTPTSSFESDVMGITPIDNSQLDNP